jgi:catechol 2,3-dioxygenase-like lactoylglutathione lyase family enzyme
MASAVQLGPLGQISRAVRNIEESVRWYRDVVGLPHLYTYGELAFFDCGGVRLFLSQRTALGEDSLLYFQVPEIRQAHDELKQRGAVFQALPHRIHTHADGTEEWMAFFDDPEGRPLAIMAQVRPSA